MTICQREPRLDRAVIRGRGIPIASTNTGVGTTMNSGLLADTPLREFPC
jgi:hypothetical protein